MFELVYEKTGSKEKPSYEARLVWDTLYLRVGNVYKGETTTEFGPMPCWVCDGFGEGAPSFKRKTLSAVKLELEQSFFHDVQTKRVLPTLTLPMQTAPAAELQEAQLQRTGTVEPEGQPIPDSSTKPSKRLFGRGE